MRILKERKLYESQREQLQQQSFNMEQAAFTTENLKNVMTTVDAMKTANQTMKQQYKKVNLDKIEVWTGSFCVFAMLVDHISWQVICIVQLRGPLIFNFSSLQ